MGNYFNELRWKLLEPTIFNLRYQCTADYRRVYLQKEIRLNCPSNAKKLLMVPAGLLGWKVSLPHMLGNQLIPDTYFICILWIFIIKISFV